LLERPVACGLLGHNVMLTAALTADDRLALLRFAASFLWADLEVREDEARFFRTLAHELDVDDAVDDLLVLPPIPEDVDPNDVTPRMAEALREIALRAIAADGVVDGLEMDLFELLDELIPR